MKLSIWQQFSSNHSAAFSIVAKFESAEKAQKVAAQVTQMLLETYRWKEYRLENWTSRNPSQIKHLFEHDATFGTSWMLSEGHIRRALQVSGKEIFVSDAPGYSNFDGSDMAFVTLFEQFGADVIALREEAGGFVYLNLSGDAVDEESAELAMAAIIERRTYTGEKEYIHNLQTLEGYHPAAEAVRREGKRLFFEDIFASPHLGALNYWYAFIKAYSLNNVIMKLRNMQSEKSLDISLDDTKFQQLVWYSQTFRNWADTVKHPQFALGEFERQADAYNAANKIREILLSLQTWSRENPTESLRVWDSFWERLSPIEEMLKHEYDIEWSMSVIEWMHYCKQAADFILVQVDTRIFLGNRENSWIGVSPFDKLLEKLGVLRVEQFSRSIPHFDFEIAAKNSTEAEVLLQMIELKDDNLQYHWLPFYRHYANPQEWQDDVEYLRLQNEAAKAYHDSLQTFIDYRDDLKIEYRLTEFLQKVYTIHDLFDERTLRMKAIVRDCDFSFKTIYSKDNILTIEGGTFEKAASLLGLEAFIVWLHSKNCDVKITISKT